MSRGRRGAATRDLRSTRRGSRLARVARRARHRTGHREPEDRGSALRSQRSDRRACRMDVRLNEPFAPTESPLILATGGFPVRLASQKEACCSGRTAGARVMGSISPRSAERRLAGDLDEFYGRAMPAVEQMAEEDYVRMAQLYGRHATVTAHDMSERFEGEPSWSETDLVQADCPLARRACLVHDRSREGSTSGFRERTVGRDGRGGARGRRARPRGRRPNRGAG